MQRLHPGMPNIIPNCIVSISKNNYSTYDLTSKISNCYEITLSWLSTAKTDELMLPDIYDPGQQNQY